MTILVDSRTGPIVQTDGAGDQALRQGRMGALIVSQGHGRYFEQATRRNLFRAQAIVTAPVIYTTAAGTGGPLLWNGTNTVNAVILGVGFGVTTASTVAGALGLTGNTGQVAAPSSTTAIDSSGCTYLGGPPPACSVYRVGTPTNAGNFLMPFAEIHTGTVGTDTGLIQWVDLAGQIVVPPYSWVSIAASATLTTAVMQISLVWEEVPNGN